MTNITINIKNCGCGGGSSGSSGGGASGGWIVEPPFNEFGYPQLPAGPPDGYSLPPGTLADRQCKMAVWLYDWVEAAVDTMANTSTGAVLLSVLRAGKSVPGGKILLPIATGIVGFVFGVILTPGIDPGDAVISVSAMILVEGLLAALEGVSTELITQPLLQDALPKIQAAQDDIICQLSKAPDSLTAWNNYSKLLSDLDLTWEQIAIIKGFTPRWGFTALFYSTDWWPSFDDDVLAGITTTCCGDYVDGDPITPGSVQQCQASHYILDQLIAAFQGASDELNSMNLSINPFYNDKSDIYQSIQSSLEVPDKIRDRAADYTAFVQNLTEIYYDQFSFATLQISDVGFSGLADYMTTNKATLIANLQAAIDQDAAYTSLYGTLAAWIDANVTDTDYQTWMKQAVDALIKPVTSRDDVMDLLFLQDSDLLGYALGDCNPTACELLWSNYGGNGDLTADGTQRTLSSKYNSQNGKYYIDFGNPACCKRVQVLSMTATDWSGGAIHDCFSGVLWDWTNNGGSIVGTWDTVAFHDLSQNSAWSMEVIISEIP